MNHEDKWIEDIAKGSEAALQNLYEKYASKVFSTIISYTKNKEDAEEILQDVFVSIHNTAGKFRFGSSVSTWVYRIAVNKSLDFLRKKNSSKRSGLFTSLYKRDSGEVAIESKDFIHPGVTLENAENAKILFRVIEDLPENQKTAFILTQIEGLPQNEVAQIMELSRKAVESLVQRAKANLRKSLEIHYSERGISTKKTS